MHFFSRILYSCVCKRAYLEELNNDTSIGGFQRHKVPRSGVITSDVAEVVVAWPTRQQGKNHTSLSHDALGASIWGSDPFIALKSQWFIVIGDDSTLGGNEK